MMQPKRIDVEMSTATLDRISDIIAHSERTDNCIFLLQVYADGTAEGLYLPEKDALKVKAVLKPVWEKAREFPK